MGDDTSRLNESWADAHADFHQALILLDLASSLRDSAELYRRWSFRSHGRERDVASEHQALLDASLDRNIEQAEQLLRDHLQKTADNLLDELRHRRSQWRAA